MSDGGDVCSNAAVSDGFLGSVAEALAAEAAVVAVNGLACSLLMMMKPLTGAVSILPKELDTSQSFPISELHAVKKPGPENTDGSETEDDDDDEDDDEGDDQDDDGGEEEDGSGEEGEEEGDPEDEPAANGEGGSGDDDDDDDDDDDGEDEDEDDEDDEDEDDEDESPQPPAKKRK